MQYDSGITWITGRSCYSCAKHAKQHVGITDHVTEKTYVLDADAYEQHSVSSYHCRPATTSMQRVQSEFAWFGQNGKLHMRKRVPMLVI